MKPCTSLHHAVVTGLAIALLAIPARADDSAAPSDKDLAMAIAHKLARIPPVNAARINVSNDNGVITLSGTASSIPEQDRAIRAAKSFRGVRDVVDNIEIARSDRADEAIQDDVQWTLKDDPFLGTEALEATVTDGIVTIQGTVDHYQKKRLAQELAENVNGVSGVTNNITLAYAAPRTEDDIRAEIAQRLRETRHLRDNAIEIDVDGSRVELEGEVDTPLEEETAIDLAWVPGVTEVESDLDVEWREDTAAAEALSDDDLEAVIERRLELQPVLGGADLDVDVVDRVATLSGTVASLRAKQVAAREAQRVGDVVRVNDRIRVTGGVNDPSTVQASVLRAFNSNASLADDNIEVRVEGSTVYLYGEVDNAEERQGAANIANRRPGVSEVVNNINVPDWVKMSDAEIKEAVESEYAWSAFVDGSDINVDVNDGVVTLTGTVEDIDEFEAAIENAYEAGARDVVARMNLEDGTGLGDHMRVQAKYSYKKE